MRIATVLAAVALILPLSVAAQEETRDQRLARQVLETEDQIAQLEERLRDLKTIPVEIAGVLIAIDADMSRGNHGANEIALAIDRKVAGLKEQKKAAEGKVQQALEAAKSAPAESLAEARRVAEFAQARVDMLARMIADSEADAVYLRKMDRQGQALIERKRAFAQGALEFLKKQKKFLEDSRSAV